VGSKQGRPEIPAGMKDSMREVRFTSAEGEGSIRSKLAKSGPIAVRLSIPHDTDVEGHSLGDTVVLAIAKFDDSDVEGHALSIHFPDAGQARRFRNEMIAAGALTATLALGVGLSQVAPNAQLGQSQVGAGAQSNAAVWIDTSAGMREASLGSLSIGAQAGTSAQVREGNVSSASVGAQAGTSAQVRESGSAAAPAVQIPHQVAPDEGGAAAPNAQVPQQVPPDDR
jgi:hypothetical protein